MSRARSSRRAVLGFTHTAYHRGTPPFATACPAVGDLGCGTSYFSPCCRSHGMQRGCHVHNMWAFALWIVSAARRRGRCDGERTGGKFRTWQKSSGTIPRRAGRLADPAAPAGLAETHPAARPGGEHRSLATPNEFVKEQLETRLRALVTQALSQQLGRDIQLAVTVDPAPPRPRCPDPGRDQDLGPERRSRRLHRLQGVGLQGWACTGCRRLPAAGRRRRPRPEAAAPHRATRRHDARDAQRRRSTPARIRAAPAGRADPARGQASAAPG